MDTETTNGETATIAESPDLRPFFLLWSGQALSLLGSQVAQFALIWWLTLESGSATILTAATFLGIVPIIVIGPLAGALIDRFSRRRILLVADASIAVVSLLLAFLYWHGSAETWHVLTALFLRAVATGFHQPTMMASTSLMVGKDHLTRIQGLNQTLEGLLLILSAPLAGLLLAVMPIAAILGLDVLTAAFAIAPLFVIGIPQPRGEGEDEEGSSVLRDMAEGWRFVREWPGLQALLVMSAVNNLFLVPAFALLPLLVQGHFGRGPLELGWMTAVFGVGLVVGGVVLGVWGGFRRRMITSLCALLGLAAAVLVVGLAPASGFGLALGGMAMVGVMAALANGPIRAVFQAAVPPEFQGRVFTLLQTLAGAAAPLGLLAAGPLADLFGIRIWFLAGAAVCAAMAVVGFAVPAILNIEDFAGGGEDSPAMETVES